MNDAPKSAPPRLLYREQIAVQSCADSVSTPLQLPARVCDANASVRDGGDTRVASSGERSGWWYSVPCESVPATLRHSDGSCMLWTEPTCHYAV